MSRTTPPHEGSAPEPPVDTPASPALPQDGARRTDLTEVVQDALRDVVELGRARLMQAADDGRSLLRLRTAQRELDDFWVRLGKTAYRLQQSGEIDHPALARAEERITALEAEVERLRGGARPGADEPTDPAPDPAPDGTPAGDDDGRR